MSRLRMIGAVVALAAALTALQPKAAEAGKAGNVIAGVALGAITAALLNDHYYRYGYGYSYGYYPYATYAPPPPAYGYYYAPYPVPPRAYGYGKPYRYRDCGRWGCERHW